MYNPPKCHPQEVLTTWCLLENQISFRKLAKWIQLCELPVTSEVASSWFLHGQYANQAHTPERRAHTTSGNKLKGKLLRDVWPHGCVCFKHLSKGSGNEWYFFGRAEHDYWPSPLATARARVPATSFCRKTSQPGMHSWSLLVASELLPKGLPVGEAGLAVVRLGQIVHDVHMLVVDVVRMRIIDMDMVDVVGIWHVAMGMPGPCMVPHLFRVVMPVHGANIPEGGIRMVVPMRGVRDVHVVKVVLGTLVVDMLMRLPVAGVEVILRRTASQRPSAHWPGTRNLSKWVSHKKMDPQTRIYLGEKKRGPKRHTPKG